jgi:hypothetical protein
VRIGQVIPIAAAHRMYSATAERPIPTDWITRALAPPAYFAEFLDPSASAISRRASDLPRRAAKGVTLPAQIADTGSQLTLSTGWPPSIGIDGCFRSDKVDRFPLESVAALARNR